MPSENNHIDNFLRNKASEATVDVSGVDAGWLQMKELMVKPSTVPAKPVSTARRLMRYLPYAAGVIMVVTTVTIMVATGKKKSPAPVVASSTATVAPTKKNQPEQKVATQTTTATIQERKTKTSIPKKIKSSAIILVENNVPVPEHISTTIAIKPDAKTDYDNFYDALKVETQDFIIDTKKDTTILCKERSRLFVPAGSFQALNGRPINGTVTISVQEFYSFTDIISNKLSTTSNSMPLETGGMLSIQAMADGEEVVIRPGHFLDLKMPTRDFNPEMQLFTGQKRELTLMDTIKASLPAAFIMEMVSDTARVNFNKRQEPVRDTISSTRALNTGIDWQPAGQQQLFFIEKAKTIKVLDLHSGPYLHENSRGVAKFMISPFCQLSTSEMEQRIRQKYSHYYDKIKVKRAWKRRVSLFEDVEPVMIGDSIYVTLQTASLWKIITRKDSLLYEEQFRKQYEDAGKYKKSYEGLVERRSEYSFRLGDLGWVNCDRFLDYPPSRLTKFTLNPGEGFEGTYFQSILVFEKEKAVMPGFWNNGLVNFVNLPVGHTVHLVCMGVKDGKMMTSMQTFVIDGKSNPALQFEETSPEQFREKMDRLGNVKSI